MLPPMDFDRLQHTDWRIRWVEQASGVQTLDLPRSHGNTTVWRITESSVSETRSKSYVAMPFTRGKAVWIAITLLSPVHCGFDSPRSSQMDSDLANHPGLREHTGLAWKVAKSLCRLPAVRIVFGTCSSVLGKILVSVAR